MRTTTPNTMDPEKILNDCRDLLDGTVSVDSYGERALYYNPCGKLKRGIYILTIKEKDGPNDKSSRLDRDKIFPVEHRRTKIDLRTAVRLAAPRPRMDGIVDMDADFTLTDRILPHPIYAWMDWICVLNPSEKTFEILRPLIEKYARR